MNNLIKAIYYGDIPPLWELDTRTAEYNEKSKKIQKNWEEIVKKFPDTEELLEEYKGAHYEAGNVMNFQQFLLGMKVGAQLMIELLQPIETNNMKG